jgi:hypothetical protein
MFGTKRRAEKRAAAQARAQAELRSAISVLIDIAGGGSARTENWPLMLKPGERLVYGITGAGLFEPRREPGHWSGRSAGFSVPVGEGIRMRIGKSAGTYVQGDETPTIIDHGDVSFTTQRAVFQGGKYTREWLFSKLVGVMHYAGQPWTAIQVSNRQKTSGIVYAGVSPDVVRLGLAVAIAICHGESQEVTRELGEELAALDAKSAPVASPALSTAVRPPAHPVDAVHQGARAQVSASLPPPAWAADPTGRHQLRYWDGKAWTDYVADNGQESRDSTVTGSDIS